MKNPAGPRARRNPTFEVVILAGGLSSRMGREKSRVRLNGRSMLSLIQGTARELGWPVRVVRRDAVSRCGPIGGVLTGLRTTRARAVLFLACDMPLVSAALLRRHLRLSKDGTRPVVSAPQHCVGFPFVLPVSALSVVEAQVALRALSIHELADALDAYRTRPPAGSCALFNVNTPEEKLEAERILRRRGSAIK